MPRIIRTYAAAKPRFPFLVDELAEELRNPRAAGQPWIEEQQYPQTGLYRVAVLWDKWANVPDEDRSNAILQAYSDAQGLQFRDRIALALGMTYPEAYEAGMLPYRIVAAVRRDADPVTLEQCAEAMIDQGASRLFGSDAPQLRFATEEDAEACRQRLIRALPGSEPVWLVEKETPSPAPT